MRTEKRTMSVSIAARLLLMSAYLYYRRQSPVIPDSAYDALSLVVAGGWEELDEHLRWQLGDPDSVRATGAHFRITAATENGALAWHFSENGTGPAGYSISSDEWREGPGGVRWVPADA